MGERGLTPGECLDCWGLMSGSLKDPRKGCVGGSSACYTNLGDMQVGLWHPSMRACVCVCSDAHMWPVVLRRGLVSRVSVHSEMSRRPLAKWDAFLGWNAPASEQGIGGGLPFVPFLWQAWDPRQISPVLWGRKLLRSLASFLPLESSSLVLSPPFFLEAPCWVWFPFALSLSLS